MPLTRQQVAQLFAKDIDRYGQEKQEAVKQVQNFDPFSTGLGALTKVGVGALTGGVTGGLGGAIAGGIQGAGAKDPISAGLGGMSAGTGLGNIAGGSKDVMTQLGAFAKPENIMKTSTYLSGIEQGKPTEALYKLGKLDEEAIEKKAKQKKEEEEKKVKAKQQEIENKQKERQINIDEKYKMSQIDKNKADIEKGKTEKKDLDTLKSHAERFKMQTNKTNYAEKIPYMEKIINTLLQDGRYKEAKVLQDAVKAVKKELGL